MQKLKTLYIWEGPETVSLLKGSCLEDDGRSFVKKADMRYKGLFKRAICFSNIPDNLIGTPKNLNLGSIVPGWQAIRIKMDFNTKEAYAPDVPPALLTKIEILQHEVELWKRKYFDAKRMNMDREQKDRFKERVKKDFKFVQEAKGFSPYGDMFGSPFMRGGFGGGPPGEM